MPHWSCIRQHELEDEVSANSVPGTPVIGSHVKGKQTALVCPVLPDLNHLRAPAPSPVMASCDSFTLLKEYRCQKEGEDQQLHEPGHGHRMQSQAQ